MAEDYSTMSQGELEGLWYFIGIFGVDNPDKDKIIAEVRRRDALQAKAQKAWDDLPESLSYTDKIRRYKEIMSVE